jgi:hypothetical protein
MRSDRVRRPKKKGQSRLDAMERMVKSHNRRARYCDMHDLTGHS